jgi:thymidylate synthase
MGEEINKLDKNYLSLLRDILNDGVEKSDRTGTGTISLFGRQIRHDMSDGFPLLTTKKMAIKTMMTELKWFLKGDTNIKYLVDNGCNIWNGDAYKNYVSKVEEYTSTLNVPNDISEFQEVMDSVGNQIKSSVLTKEEFINKIKTDDKFAKKWGELGPIYGKQWRDWDGRQERDGSYDMSLDQIANLIFQLKRNPDSRRLMVSAWNVGELSEMTLPPCHYGFQVYTRPTTRQEKIVNPGKYRAISLMWNQRSVDTALGLPFNIASYGTLLQLIADECNMIAGELIGNLGDVHLYKNHIQGAKEQIVREPFKLPEIKLSNVDILNGEFDYEIIGYEPHPTIKFPLSN